MATFMLILRSNTYPMKNIITLLLTVFATISMTAEVSPSDKTVLMNLYLATNGENWTNKWDLNAPVSTWYGVKLIGDKVVALNLSSNNLVGELPEDLASLIDLQILNLHKNGLHGVIPATVGNLKNLRTLDLSFNKLAGTIPAAICELENLRNL